MRKSISLLFIFIAITFQVSGQKVRVTKFEYSSCLGSSNGEHSSIAFQKVSDYTSIIKLRTYAPCNGNLAGNIEMIGANTVNLKFEVKPTVIKDKQGKIHLLLEVAECNCLFDLQYKVQTSIDLSATTILVNKESLEEIDKHNILSEEKIPLDEEIKNK